MAFFINSVVAFCESLRARVTADLLSAVAMTENVLLIKLHADLPIYTHLCDPITETHCGFLSHPRFFFIPKIKSHLAAPRLVAQQGENVRVHLSSV